MPLAVLLIALVSLVLGVVLALAWMRRHPTPPPTPTPTPPLAPSSDPAASVASLALPPGPDLAALQARTQALFAQGPVVLLRTRFGDTGLQITEVSDNVRELWGYTPAQLQALPDGLALFAPEDREQLQAHQSEALAQGQDRVQAELRVRLPDGRLRWHRYYELIDLESQATLGYLLDIDERKQAEQQSAQKESQLQTMVSELRTAQREGLVLQETSDMLHSTEALPEAFEIIRLAAERLFAGWSGWIASVQGGELVVGAHWGEEHHLPPHGFETRDCWALRRGKTHVYIDANESVCCTHLAHLPPEERWPYLCMPMAAHGETVGSLHLYTNEVVTESELQSVQARASRFAETLKLALSNLKLRASLQEQATRDALTGLYNRRYLDEALATELNRARRTGAELAVAMVDVDHFKRFNDSWGHEAGDLVLQAVGKLLQARLRNYDLACRYGGEEMALVLPGCALPAAQARLEQIREAVAQLSLDHKGRALPPVTISIGLTDAAGDDADAVMRRADMALYEAKHAGRNRLVLAAAGGAPDGGPA